MPTEDDLDRELAAAGRVSLTASARQRVDELVVAFSRSDVRQSISSESVPRRLRPWIIIPAVIAALAVPAGAVAIGSYSAHTGIFGGAGTEVVDRSEWIGLEADDAPQAIAELYEDSLALPPGATRDDVIRPIAAMYTEVSPDEEAGHLLAQASTIRWSFERAARCLWYREWLDADSHDDTERRATAAAGLVDAATWPRTVAADGGGVVDALERAADDAKAGDRAAVLEAYGKCSLYYGEVEE